MRLFFAILAIPVALITWPFAIIHNACMNLMQYDG